MNDADHQLSDRHTNGPITSVVSQLRAVEIADCVSGRMKLDPPRSDWHFADRDPALDHGRRIDERAQVVGAAA